MINASFIYNSANQLIKTIGTRDPVKIALDLNIELFFSNILTTKLLGFYKFELGVPFIMLNNNVNEYVRNMVCAHELGHHILHQDIAKDEVLYDYEILNIKNNTEYEANAFASHILIDDDDLFSLLKEGKSITETSKTLNINYNLSLIKLQEFNRMGMNLNIPCPADSFFFKNPDTLTKNDF